MSEQTPHAPVWRWLLDKSGVPHHILISYPWGIYLDSKYAGFEQMEYVKTLLKDYRLLEPLKFYNPPITKEQEETIYWVLTL